LDIFYKGNKLIGFRKSKLAAYRANAFKSKNIKIKIKKLRICDDSSRMLMIINTQKNQKQSKCLQAGKHKAGRLKKLFDKQLCETHCSDIK
jgi:hypothetical protein